MESGHAQFYEYLQVICGVLQVPVPEGASSAVFEELPPMALDGLIEQLKQAAAALESRSVTLAALAQEKHVRATVPDLTQVQLQVLKNITSSGKDFSNQDVDRALALSRSRTRAESRAIKAAMLAFGYTFKQLWIEGRPAWRWVR